MMAPWPGIRRGTEADVPSVPGFVREIVVPSKSETCSLPVRARVMTSSEAATNSRKRHLFRALDVRDEEGARTVRLGDVHGQTEADLLAPDARGLPSHRLEGVVHRGECLHALDHGPRDEVREGDLGLLRLRPRLVDEPAVFIEQLDRDLALRGRRRNGQARLHVLGDSRGGAAQRDPLAERRPAPRLSWRQPARDGPEARQAPVREPAEEEPGSPAPRRTVPGSSGAIRRRPRTGWPGTDSTGPRRSSRWRRTRRGAPPTHRPGACVWT